MNQTDFTEVLICHDIDKAVAILTEKIKQVLDRHALWVIFQQRKNFATWLTGSTLKNMKKRDPLKAKASKLAAKGQNPSELWSKYKTLRNTINNRRRHEENKFKAEKMGDSLSSASDTWRVAKTFMDWTASSGPPN